MHRSRSNNEQGFAAHDPADPTGPAGAAVEPPLAAAARRDGEAPASRSWRPAAARRGPTPRPPHRPVAGQNDEAAPSTGPRGTIDDSDGAAVDDVGTGALPSLELTWVELGFVSAYVLVRGNEAAIVDTGVEGSGAAIVDALGTVGLGPADVRHVVLTHHHGDHVGGLAELERSMPDATVSAGPGDIDDIRTSLALREVTDGDEVFGLGVVQTPGHTPGSISVFDVDTGLIVAGDAINGDGSGGLLGANERFTADMAAAGRSIAKLAALEPAVAAFGHGGAPVDREVAAQLAALAG